MRWCVDNWKAALPPNKSERWSACDATADAMKNYRWYLKNRNL